MGTLIAVIGESGDDISGAADLLKEEAHPSTPQKEEPKHKDTPPPTNLSEPGSPGPSISASELQITSPKPVDGAAKHERIFASPIAKKLALERGIPLAQIKGSGPLGRIVLSDIESYKPSSTTQTSPSTTSASDAPYTDIPLSNMRRTIGQRLTSSKQDIPHYYVTVDIDMGRLLKLREVFNQNLEKADKLSVNDFIIKACALALRDVPEANAAWMGETIRQSVLHI